MILHVNQKAKENGHPYGCDVRQVTYSREKVGHPKAVIPPESNRKNDFEMLIRNSDQAFLSPIETNRFRAMFEKQKSFLWRNRGSRTDQSDE